MYNVEIKYIFHLCGRLVFYPLSNMKLFPCPFTADLQSDSALHDGNVRNVKIRNLRISSQGRNGSRWAQVFGGLTSSSLLLGHQCWLKYPSIHTDMSITWDIFIIHYQQRHFSPRWLTDCGLSTDCTVRCIIFSPSPFQPHRNGFSFTTPPSFPLFLQGACVMTFAEQYWKMYSHLSNISWIKWGVLFRGQ